MYVHMCVSIYSGQKRVLNLLKLEVQDFASHSVCVCWNQNLGPLQEHQVILSTDPYLHLQFVTVCLDCFT